MIDWIAIYMRMMELIYRRADEFDVLHFHTDYFPLSLFSRQRTPFLTTLHGRLDIPEFKDVYELFDAPFVSISDSQRRPIPRLNWIRTVHHGMPANLLTPQSVEQDYLAFLGRISPEKGVDRAIKIARTLGIPFKIAAKVDRVDETYFREHIAPLLKAPGVEFIGEINEQEKTEFLGQALALMFLIDWPEPFGLSMIEAMACGTPVLAFKRGAVEEVLENGITGYLVDTLEEAIAAVPRVVGLDRRTVRRQFESRFTSTRMAKDYAKVYKLLLDQMSLTAKIELIPVSRVPTQVEPVPTAPAQYAIEPNEPAI